MWTKASTGTIQVMDTTRTQARLLGHIFSGVYCVLSLSLSPPLSLCSLCSLGSLVSLISDDALYSELLSFYRPNGTQPFDVSQQGIVEDLLITQVLTVC